MCFLLSLSWLFIDFEENVLLSTIKTYSQVYLQDSDYCRYDIVMFVVLATRTGVQK